MALSNVDTPDTPAAPAAGGPHKITALDRMVGEAIAADEAADAEERAKIDEAKARDAEAFDGPADKPKRGSKLKVTAYDANGEAKDFDVPPPPDPQNPPAKAKAQEPESPPLPGFDVVMPWTVASRASKVVVNLSGRLELNMQGQPHRDLWNALRPEARVVIEIEGVQFEGFVAASAGKSARDKDGEVKERTASKSLVITVGD